MEQLNTLCVFCEKDLVGDTVVIKKGLQAVIEASLKRGDGIKEKLEGKSVIKVHKHCRQNYTRPSTIKAELTAKAAYDHPQPSTSTGLRSAEESFDFKRNCFICGSIALIDKKLPTERRKSIHNVATLEIRDKILKECDERSDDWGNKVKARLINVSDLIAPEARYHRSCHRDFFRNKSQEVRGRPKSALSDQFEKLCEYIEVSDECQFTIKGLQDIMEEMSEEYSTFLDQHLKKLLKTHFSDRLSISNVSGRKNVICLSDTANKIIDQWYRDRESDPKTEKLRIVLAAADIIKEDIQKMAYNSRSYPSVDEITLGGESLVPETLRAFTERVTKKKTAIETKKVTRKCNVINQTIIASVRPRSFLSPLQISLGLTLHRMFASKHLIDLLSSLGVCASYYEVTTYMESLIKSGSPSVNESAFTQYVFDNADVNIRTLDGLNTFHAMGGIKCITPSSCVDTHVEVERKQPGSFNQEVIKLFSYPKRNRKSGLSSIHIEDYSELLKPRDIECVHQDTVGRENLMWLAVSKAQPGWNGFMNAISLQNEDCDPTYIMGIPFINMDPSNPSTIFTALSFAAEQCRKNNQACIVTFDQPLFLKASEIVASADQNSDISRIILRLGGFHLLMSFMGSIGRIMEGSGLDCLWATVYGQATVIHMMNGHAYARGIRAYTLTACALIDVIKEHFPEINESMNTLERFSKKLLNQEIDWEKMFEEPLAKEAFEKIAETFKTIKNSSRTSKLWINLLKYIDIILQFIYAERSGNWDLHMKTTVEMLPYFHAAGHLPYAKSAHLYVQQMTNIKSKLSNTEFELFTKKGMFTVRRSGKFWSGTWTDMCIEQGLMRPMKAVGGLTHGRGISESTLEKWILGAPYFLKIHEAVEEFCGTSILFSEQHVELRESRKTRDIADIEKFTTWLQHNNPFTKLSGELISLSSGFVSDDSVNCDEAFEVGVTVMNKIKGKTFDEVKLHRKDMVKTQASRDSVKIRSRETTVNTQQLFNRILCVCDSPLKLNRYLEFELASRPPSLFDDASLRKGTKSSLMKAFEIGIVNNIDLSDAAVVVDGGFLLHYVPWAKNVTYGDIIQNYCKYVLTNYGRNSLIVFDGYPEEPTTKEEEQNRRAAKKVSCDITFEKNTKCITLKEEFLCNRRNKKKIMADLANEMQQMDLATFISEGDADVNIVNLAIQKLETFSKVVVVGTDTDLIVLLVALAPEEKNIYFRKPTGGKVPMILHYEIKSLIEHYRENRKLLLFAHAVSGCDTTSCFFSLGKMKSVNMVTASETGMYARSFIDPSASRDELLLAGEKFVLELYGLSRHNSLNEARYYKFTTLTKKSTLRSNFDLARLPPTSEACHEHLYRVYLQVQTWLGNQLLPTDWGWRMELVKENGTEKKTLKPIASSKPFAPDDLLSIVSCACKSLCLKNCRCRKIGLNCSAMCETCCGLSCHNSVVITEDSAERLPFDE